MSETTDLAATLLAADLAEREQLLRSADPAELNQAVQALGHRREPAAAEILAQVDDVIDDRVLRKAARRELHRLRSMGVEPPWPPERGLIYETISPVEVNFNPGWLDESPRLLGEPEVAGWYVPVPAEFRARALEVARAPSAGLLVPGHTPEQQALQLVADASRQALTPTALRGLRRRIEETGYIFLQTDRLGLARLAAAAARALDTGGVPPDR